MGPIHSMLRVNLGISTATRSAMPSTPMMMVITGLIQSMPSHVILQNGSTQMVTESATMPTKMTMVMDGLT